MRGMRRAAVFLLALTLAGCVHAGRESGAPPERSQAFRDGEAALLLEDYAAAEAAFTRARAQAGEDLGRAAEASYWVGVCRRKRGDDDGAQRAWATALATTDPAVAARTRLQLGGLAWDRREWRAARESYAAVLAAGPDATQLLREERESAARRAALAAIRAGQWDAGTKALQRLATTTALLARVLEGGQFACVLGPFPPTESERRLEAARDGGRDAQTFDGAEGVWIILRPFDDWDAAEAAAARWRAEQVPAAALP